MSLSSSICPYGCSTIGHSLVVIQLGAEEASPRQFGGLSPKVASSLEAGKMV